MNSALESVNGELVFVNQIAWPGLLKKKDSCRKGDVDGASDHRLKIAYV